MATQNEGQSRQKRFETYNPYAARLTGGRHDAQVAALLAVAFEIDRLRTEIHFAGKGRSS